jgi:hypothetical protein
VIDKTTANQTKRTEKTLKKLLGNQKRNEMTRFGVQGEKNSDF